MGGDEVWMGDIYNTTRDEGVAPLQREFDHAFETGDTAAACTIGERLIELTRELHLERDEALALVGTADAYHERMDGDRGLHIERACALYEQALEILRRIGDPEAQALQVR